MRPGLCLSTEQRRERGSGLPNWPSFVRLAALVLFKMSRIPFMSKSYVPWRPDDPRRA